MRQSRQARFLAGVGATALAVTATSLLAAPAQAAEGEIRAADAAVKVQDHFIVKLKDGSAASADSLAKQYGGQVDTVFSKSLNGFTVSLPEKAAKRLAANPAVEYVEQDQVFTTQATQSNAPWGLDRIDQRNRPLS
ncbi:protease inhibitor I9 family protein, partial [Saccharothrix sp. MB29]|nr:protease inhibitor I9 family protein [Saccharothrix sp. MB29]